MTKLQPHCGVCTQCIDRRFASISAGLEDHDLASKYERDIFLSPLIGINRAHAENYVRFAIQLENIKTPDAFFQKFPELFDCLPEKGDVALFAADLYELFQRHQKCVNSVLESRIQANLSNIRRASVDRNCLLHIVSSGQHSIDPKNRYIERLRALIIKNLPAAFQTVKAKNERHVQDVGQGVFQSAQDTLMRETPQIPFSVISTKPDFSDNTSDGKPLFIEFKYIKGRNRLNSIHTEMTSRVTIYGDQGAWTLFIVYDPNRIILDDDRFTHAFEKFPGIWIGIVR
jgi:hypothetical protein